MHDGRIAGELLPAAATERAIGLLMAGVPQPRGGRTRRFRGWVVPALLPAINLALALALSAVVVLLVGESPLRALRLLADRRLRQR